MAPGRERHRRNRRDRRCAWAIAGTGGPSDSQEGARFPCSFTRISPRRGRPSTPSRARAAASPPGRGSTRAVCRAPRPPGGRCAPCRTSPTSVAHGRRVVDRAQYVLQAREALQRFPRALALVQAGEEIRRVAELLDRDAQPVQLRGRQAREPAPALAHPVVALLEHRARELQHRRREARAPRFVEPSRPPRRGEPGGERQHEPLVALRGDGAPRPLRPPPAAAPRTARRRRRAPGARRTPRAPAAASPSRTRPSRARVRAPRRATSAPPRWAPSSPRASAGANTLNAERSRRSATRIWCRYSGSSPCQHARARSPGGGRGSPRSPP